MRAKIMAVLACSSILGCTVLVGTESRVVGDGSAETPCEADCASTLSDCERRCGDHKDSCKLCTSSSETCNAKCAPTAR